MNFRDVYKEANDEIKGNREILNRPVKRKNTYKSASKIIYAFGSAAAAAILLFSVAYMPDFHERPTDEKAQNEDVSAFSTTEASDNEHAAAGGGTEEAASIEETETKNADEARKSASSASTFENTYGENPTVSEDNAETKTFSADAPQNTTEGSYESEAAEADGNAPAAVSERHAPAAFSLEEAADEGGKLGGGSTEKESTDNGVSTAVLRSSGAGGAADAERKALSREEFFALSGLNEEKLSLSGFETLFSDEAEAVYSPSGEAVFYSATFYLSSENSHMSVTVSKSNGTKSESLDTYEDEVYASADDENLSVYISALNVPKDTVAEYLKRIIS